MSIQSQPSPDYQYQGQKSRQDEEDEECRKSEDDTLPIRRDEPNSRRDELPIGDEEQSSRRDEPIARRDEHGTRGEQQPRNVAEQNEETSGPATLYPQQDDLESEKDDTFEAQIKWHDCNKEVISHAITLNLIDHQEEKSEEEIEVASEKEPPDIEPLVFSLVKMNDTNTQNPRIGIEILHDMMKNLSFKEFIHKHHRNGYLLEKHQREHLEDDLTKSLTIPPNDMPYLCFKEFINEPHLRSYLHEEDLREHQEEESIFLDIEPQQITIWNTQLLSLNEFLDARHLRIYIETKVDGEKGLVSTEALADCDSEISVKLTTLNKRFLGGNPRYLYFYSVFFISFCR